MSDQSRRSWMVTISQTVVGLGVANRLLGAAPDSAALPPGLYQPSSDHLGHALMSAEQFHSIPPDCPTDYVRPRIGPFQPSFFSASQFRVVHRFTALLLGETGAAASGQTPDSLVEEVAEWIDLRVAAASGMRQAALRINPLYRNLAIAYHGAAHVKETETADPAAICREGLDSLGNFLALGTEEQLAWIYRISDQRPDPEVQNAGTRFFEFMKGETIRAFYTSRAGLKELDYKGNAFYARSPGCDAK